MIRFDDWQTRLTAYLADFRGRSFRWGQTDCAMFIAGAVEAMTGEDIAKGWRGYRSEDEAHRMMADKGFPEGADHADVIASMLPEEPHPLLAKPGDVVLTTDRALGIRQGRMIYAMSPSGLALVSMDKAVKAYTV